MMWLSRLLAPLTGAAVLAASSSVAVRNARQLPADTVSWRIVDTVMVNPPGEGCCYAIRAFHVEVREPTGWRKLPHLQLLPAQLPGRALLLRIVNPDQSIVLRRYSLVGGALSIVPPPPAYDSSYTWPEFHSSRRLLVYTVPVQDTGTRVIVRRWPGWDLAVQSPAIERCDDAMLGASWTADGRFVVWYPPHCEDSTPEVDSLAVPH